MLSFLLEYLSGSIEIADLLLIIGVDIFVTLCCLPVHECAHAWMADKLGDSTAKLQGRITLNPLAHLSLTGTLMMLIFGFGYAKPVSVNIRNFKNRKVYFALTALAGPLSNILLSVIFLVIAYLFSVAGIFSDASIIQIVVNFFYNAAYFNVMLAVFNLLPVPPLDGSRLVTMVIPDKYYYKLLALERYFVYILFALIYFFNRILDWSPITVVAEFVFNCIDFVISLPFNLIF